ncbi:MAG: AraC family transcriptional regulator [Bacteroidota bacterium]|nr:AraC family transcriptional regulator [Bacteroidota bacterium]
MQISFFQYLKTLRMTKAIELILKTDQPISDIAFHCGYKNIGAFSNAFYEFTNARPTDFRKVRKR